MPREHLSMEKLLEQGDALPTLPEIYLKVTQQLEDSNTTAYSIGETISNDPAISSKILKMVNSAYYGLPNQISSISQAISLLGRARLKQVLVGAVMGNVFKGHNSEFFSMQEFWRHSIRTAIIAKEMALDSDFDGDVETIFTAGLLHDVGRLVLVAQAPDVLEEIDRMVINQRIGVEQAEADIVGVSHTEIGAALMQKWGFPDLIWVCAANHHVSDYSGPFFHAAHIIYLANQLAQHVPPIDENEAENMLDTIPDWQHSDVSIQSVCTACQIAEDMVFEVMESLGMVDMEISAD